MCNKRCKCRAWKDRLAPSLEGDSSRAASLEYELIAFFFFFQKLIALESGKNDSKEKILPGHNLFMTSYYSKQ